MLAPSPPAIIWHAPQDQKPSPAAPSTLPCDLSGIIRCSVTETVNGTSSVDDIRVIAHYISLVSERNQRFYSLWRERLPSAAYEVVRRIHSFPYLPYGDMYAITDMQLIVEKDRDRILVRYPKRPEDTMTGDLAEIDYVTYETPLAAFIKVVEKEAAKLKKYEKFP